ncbi:leucine-rich repeat and immunoglobulin-like domain-containing nogo receptor-interacting protein 3 [Patiria miniata]|uniref:LRRCT domain-containing protein n=1 Tax=Patiria miniata TaxID=46514 RepID=A0A913Z0I2_PATMI|nr:leucine-rich repeat and immunoglobulin-like domain-containing nogo receptor-interacting protein 3 [Patiria miniata]
MLLRLKVVLLVTLVVVAVEGETATECPNGCKCDAIMLIVNCTNSGLRQIPNNLPREYRVFSFDNNILNVIEDDAFSGVTATRSLSLSRCNITKIQDGAFDFIYNVSKLYLSENRLDTVPREVRNLSRLQLLDLTENSIDRLAMYSFYGMKNLQTLLLDDNNITVLSKGCMSDASRLRVLSLKRNGMHTVKPESFHCLNSLEELYLSDNSFANLPFGWLVGVFNLRVLDLRRAYSANVVYDPTPRENSTMGWLFPGLSPLLESLDLAENGITSLEFNAFQPLEELVWLDLSVNQLIDLPLGVFSRLRKLQRLDLSYNILTNLTDYLFPEGSELEYFDLGNNLFETMRPEPFKNLKNLKYLRLQRNVLYEIEFLLKASLPGLQELNLASNTISNVSSVGFTAFKNLRKIWMKNNRLREVPNVRNLTFLTHLDLSWNGIVYVAPDAFIGTSLKEIDLRNNYITTLDQRTLDGLPRLGAVRVGNNPWRCDCELEWFRQAYMTADWGGDLDAAICDWPPSRKDNRVVYQDKAMQCTSYPPPASVIILVVIWIAILLIVATAILVRTYKVHRLRSRRRQKEDGEEEPAEEQQPLREEPPRPNHQPPPIQPIQRSDPDKGKGKGKGKGKVQKGQVIEMKDMKPMNGLKVKPFDREFYV